MITRKDFLKSAMLIGAAMMTGLHTSILHAEENKGIDEEIRKATGKGPGEIKPEGKITLQVPTIAESGANVPVKVSIDLPVEKVKSLHIFVDNNPAPYILGMTFSPLCGQPYLEARVRFAKSSTIRSVAVLADGSAIMDQKEVKVTVGGCG